MPLTVNVQSGRKLNNKSKEDIMKEVLKVFGKGVQAVQIAYEVVRVTLKTEAEFKLAMQQSGVRLFGLWCPILGGGPPTTVVHIFDYPFEESDQIVGDTLKTYGTVKRVRKQTYISSPEVYTGTRLVSNVLTSTPPRDITIDGYPCRLWYRGQPLVCNLCGVQGHKSATCPNRDKCRRCGQTGHFARNCPNPWGNAAAAPQVPAVDDAEYPPLSSQETPSSQEVPETSTCEPPSASEESTPVESEMPTPSDTPVLFAEPGQFDNAFTSEDQRDEHVAMEQEGYFDQYLPVHEVTVSASGYIRTAPAAAVPNPAVDASQVSCVSVTPTIPPAPQNQNTTGTSQNTPSANNVMPNVGSETVAPSVVNSSAASQCETAVNTNAVSKESESAVSAKDSDKSSSNNVVNFSAASKRSVTAASTKECNNVANSSAASKGSVTAVNTKESDNVANSGAASKRSVTAVNTKQSDNGNPSAASIRSVTAVNSNESNNVVNSSAASKRSVTANDKPSKPVDESNAAPKRGATANDSLNDSSTGGATVINYNHVSENVIEYNHGETPMEISPPYCNTSDDNLNKHDSSENNSNDNNSSDSCNCNNETEDVVEVEMTTVVLTAPDVHSDVHMGSPPPTPSSQVSAAAQILSEHLPSSLRSRALRLVQHVTNGRHQLDNLVRKEAPKAQRPQRAAKAGRHKNLPQVAPRQPPRKPPRH